MAVDDLATPGARTSASMVLTSFGRNILAIKGYEINRLGVYKRVGEYINLYSGSV